MGDYVDRGLFCIEVIVLLLCLKLKYPEQIHLLRGNHESRLLTSNFNFRQECCKKYDQEMYFEFMELFDQIPLGAIIDSRYFCVHAGISPDFKTIADIQKANRFKEPPEKGGVCDLLWSDPVDGFI
jgi:serine/threonine-protein phosphatase 2B catalytic subunit